MSTFHGLEMAKRALYAQQAALYTTGHNISNANTEGYTRQRVNFETLTAYPSGSRNRPQIPGQLGQGVQAGSVERIRDSFLDLQFRAENSKSGYWETMANSLYRMESLLNEPSEGGLTNTMDKFWQSLQDLSTNPENTGARSVVVQRGLAVADTFNYLTENLKQMKTDIRSQIDVTIEDANSLLRQINSINNQIKEIEPHGYLPNDLYDERDRLIDELSGIVNIKVHRVDSSDSALDIAGGLAQIELVDDSGKSIANPPVLLVDPVEDEISYFNLAEGAEVNSITVGGVNHPLSSGSLKSLVDVHGYTNAPEDVLSFETMLQNINELAQTLTTKFNEVHRAGNGLNGQTGYDFFSYDPVTGKMSVIEDIVSDPSKIAASPDGNNGNGDYALELAKVFDEMDAFADGTTIKGYYEGVIGSLGVAAQEANRMAKNTAVLRSQVVEQRMSVSSVSLDEEMTNMIKFQHAYNAAARSMTAMDEILDKIINNMGIVGR